MAAFVNPREDHFDPVGADEDMRAFLVKNGCHLKEVLSELYNYGELPKFIWSTIEKINAEGPETINLN